MYYLLVAGENGGIKSVLMSGEIQDECTLEEIANDIAAALSIAVEELTSTKRGETLSEARMIFSHIAWKSGFSKVGIARFLNRDHSSIITSIRRYEELKNDLKFKERVKLVRECRMNRFLKKNAKP